MSLGGYVFLDLVLTGIVLVIYDMLRGRSDERRIMSLLRSTSNLLGKVCVLEGKVENVLREFERHVGTEVERVIVGTCSGKGNEKRGCRTKGNQSEKGDAVEGGLTVRMRERQKGKRERKVK